MHPAGMWSRLLVWRMPTSLVPTTSICQRTRPLPMSRRNCAMITGVSTIVFTETQPKPVRYASALFWLNLKMKFR